jgi:hypothetical protein
VAPFVEAGFKARAGCRFSRLGSVGEKAFASIPSRHLPAVLHFHLRDAVHPTARQPQIAPSGVCTMLRTTPPPDGITHVWNFSVLGSNRTTVFGCVFDSLYQIMSPTEVIP